MTITGSLDDAAALVQGRMKAAADKVEEEGGFIGHLKSIVEEAGPMCRISMTEGGISDTAWIDAPVASRAECVFIVFCVTEEQLKDWLAEIFADLL